MFLPVRPYMMFGRGCSGTAGVARRCGQGVHRCHERADGGIVTHRLNLLCKLSSKEVTLCLKLLWPVYRKGI